MRSARQRITMKILCPPSSLPCFTTRAPRILRVRSELSFLAGNANYRRELEAAVDVVQKACRLCVDVQTQLFQKDKGILEKSDRTPVTVADFGVQALVSMELTRLFPSIPLVAEEDSSQLLLDLETSHQIANNASNSLVEAVTNAVANSLSLDADTLNHNELLKAIDKGGKETISSEEEPATYWVLDPIDGTRGFLMGDKALYVVGLALVIEGRPILGVMGCPNWDKDGTSIAENLARGMANKNKITDFPKTGVIMAACYGYGTWMKSISLNAINMDVDGSHDGWIRCSVDKCDALQEARFCIGDRETWKLLPLSNTLTATSASKGFGERWKPTIIPTCCGSLCKYLMVATGRASVFLLQVKNQPFVKVWDHAVGMVCVSEAGGEVTGWDGSEMFLASDGVGRRSITPGGGGVLVTNGTLHSQLLDAL